MVGATAAGVAASQASAITINLVGNYISATGGNHLNADLTGDGHPDLTIANASAFYVVRKTYNGNPLPSYNDSYVRVNLNGVFAAASFFKASATPHGRIQLGLEYAPFALGSYGPYSLKGSIPIFFKDLHVNGGAPTKGFLEVTVSDFTSVNLDSFTYNTPIQGATVTVPDQGSSLPLLAMGAGGILALRRWRAARGRS